MENVFKNLPNNLYSSIIINNPDPIFILDDNGDVLATNVAVTDLFGYSATEIKGKNYKDILISTIDIEKKCKTLEGQFCSFHWSTYNKAGRVLHLEVKTMPVFENEKVANVIIITKDVTELVETRKALQVTSEKLRTIYASSADAMDVIDLNGNVLLVNEAFEEMYGWKAEEILGKPMPTIPADRMEKVKEEREQKLSNDQYIRGLEVECLRKDGSSIMVSVTVSPLHDDLDNVVAFLGISRDISERKRMEADLIESEKKYRLIAENMTDLVTVVNEDGIITYASPSTSAVLGFTPDDYEGKRAFHKTHPEDFPSVLTKMTELLDTKDTCEMEFRYKHKTKEWIWVEARGTYFEEDGEGFLLFVSRVIDEKKQMREKLKLLAFQDELTGLPNRRSFQKKMRDTINEAIRDETKCALLYLDIDRFKWVNDHLGHSAGDELLKQFADRVGGVLRQSDTLARQGGDEFLILLPKIRNAENVKRTAERILDSLQQEWDIEGHSFTTTSSIGVAIFPEDGGNMDELMTNADFALYQAKENGRNNYMIYS